MEPLKEAISIRLAKLSSQFLGKNAILGPSSNVLKRALNKEGLLDALTILYDECNSENLMKSDEQIAKFVDKYRNVLAELSRMRVNINDFEVKEIIGRGHFGVVHVVREKHTGDVYAMKSLRKDETIKQQGLAFYEEERDIMAFATSSYITRLQYAFQDSSHLYLVMEFCVGGDLAGMLERRGALPVESACFYVAEINQALAALHNMGYLHRDIKPDNILIDRCGHLKLADFGSSVKMNRSGRCESLIPVGTPQYIAPELLEALETSRPTQHGTSCDYWSLGIVAYELVTARTPFASRDQSLPETYSNIIKYTKNQSNINYPPLYEKVVDETYKDLVRCLLDADVKKRYNYLETLRHPALKDIPWNTIREQVPPFVPLVTGTDDTSNFTEYPKEQSKPSAANFRSRNQFSGRNLPFIGFTYSSEPCPTVGHVCCNHGGTNTSTTNSSSDTSSSCGFSHSHNSTAIENPAMRELEKLSEWRAKEIETLQQRVAVAESQLSLNSEKQIQLANEHSDKLEKELQQLIKVNHKLKRRLEHENKERRDLETKSVELMNAAKQKWSQQNQSQMETLTRSISTMERRNKELVTDNERLKAKVADVLGSLEKANSEVDTLKKLQINYKEVLFKVHELKHRRYSEFNIKPIDSMAKARKISRQSIVGLEHMSSETNNQIQTLTQSLNREVELRRALEAKVEEMKSALRCSDDKNNNLKVELDECRKDYVDLKRDKRELENEKIKIQGEVEELSRKLNNWSSIQHNQITELESKLKREQANSKTLEVKVEELREKLEQQCKLERAMEEQHERTENRLKEKLELETADRIQAQAQLEAARSSDERHKDKVSELECLVMRLEQEVSKLDLEREHHHDLHSESSAHAQVELLKEQLNKMELQLEKSREEVISLKQETRKANTALWKKEKEFSDLELDKRILTRELKQSEERCSKLAEEKTKLTESYIKSKKGIETELTSTKDQLKESGLEVDRLKLELSKRESELNEMQSSLSMERKRDERMEAEIDRYKNDIRKLKCELQYSENRRIKYEAEVEELRCNLRDVEQERLLLRENQATIKAELDERIRYCETMQANNQMLQDACTMLEEQLIDFERLNEIQESKNKSLQDEVGGVRKELDELREKLRETERELTEQQRCVELVAYEEEARKSQAQAAQQLIDHLQQRITEQEARACDLETQLNTASGEKEELKQRYSAASVRLAQLQEETSSLLTAAHQLRKDNMTLAHQLTEAQEETNIVRSESEATAAWWRARETKADATLRQQAKLIDFLQAKVEESNRKKKSLSTMLFGKSTAQTTQTPTRDTTDTYKALNAERQINRELREEIERLKHRLVTNNKKAHTIERSSVLTEITNTPKLKSASLRSNKLFDKKKRCEGMAGWLQLYRCSGSERVMASASAGVLRMSCNDGAARETAVLVAHNVTAQHALGVHLTHQQRDHAFLVKTTPLSEQILCVAESLIEKEKWLEQLTSGGGVTRSASAAGHPSVELKAVVKLIECRVNCLIEVREGLLALGTEKGLFAYKDSETQPVIITGLDSVEQMCVVEAGQCVVILTQGHLVHCCLRAMISVLERDACVKPTLHTEHIQLMANFQCLQFQVMSQRHCTTERIMLCAITSTKLILLYLDHKTNTFRQLRSMDLTCSPNAILFTPHTVLVSLERLYEIDLNEFTTEEFLDLSDSTLASAIAAYKESNQVLAVIRVKDKIVDGDFEYLICFKEFGLFVDEFGRRTRSDDVKWTTAPSTWVFRKPFLFVIQDDRVEIIQIDNCSFKSVPCECENRSTTSTVSSECQIVKCHVKMKFPKFLGKALQAGMIYIGISTDDEYSVMQLDGNAAFNSP